MTEKMIMRNLVYDWVLLKKEETIFKEDLTVCVKPCNDKYQKDQ